MARKEVQDILSRLSNERREVLIEPEVLCILCSYSVPTPVYEVISDEAEALEAAAKIGYPLVLKVVSPEIVHKSEVGGVEVGINSAEELKEKLSVMSSKVSEVSPAAKIRGFLIEKMAPKGVEVICGSLRDEQFGPAVMFGLGGVSVEILKDVSFRLAPVDEEEAMEMMREVKGFPLLNGFRGRPPMDLKALAQVIVKVSKIISDVDSIRELEINPLMVYEAGVMAVDARGTLLKKT